MTASTPNILNCNEMRFFWLSWDSGQLEVGKGMVYPEGRFIGWLDSLPHPVTTISLSTGFGASANWRFPITPGRLFVIELYTVPTFISFAKCVCISNDRILGCHQLGWVGRILQAGDVKAQVNFNMQLLGSWLCVPNTSTIYWFIFTLDIQILARIW